MPSVFIIPVDAPRAINPKAERKAKEVLFVMVPDNHEKAFLECCQKAGHSFIHREDLKYFIPKDLKMIGG